jgi:hypothetical protein
LAANPSSLAPAQTLERRLRRFGAAVSTHLLVYGAALWWPLKMTGADAGLVVILVCALPAAVAVAAALSSTADDRAAGAGATTWPLATWQWAVAAAVLHALAFVA